MLAQIEFDHTLQSRLTALGHEVYDEFRERFAELEVKEWVDTPSCPYIYDRRTLVDLATDGVWLTQHEIEFNVKRFKGAYYTDGDLNQFSRKPPKDGPPTVHIQVAIPDLALLHMDEVCVIEDACTDQLQRELHNGWRIIAVCPPNSQRRPDYVLGRRSP